MDVVFAKETLTEQLKDEALPLALEHWKEVDTGEGVDLNPNWYQYFYLQEHGFLWCFTARLDGDLIGYMSWFVTPSLHHNGKIEANEDALFVRSDRRGLMAGMKLIKYAEEYLRQETNATLFNLRVKMTHDFGNYCQRMGYQLNEKIYEKRINGCA